MSLNEINTVIKEADEVCTAEQVSEAIDKMASELDGLLKGEDAPLYICIMNGGFYTSSRLISKVNQPNLQIDYIHVSRYRNETVGSELIWETTPNISLKDRTVVLVDDIYDEGITLKEIAESCRAQGAAKVLVAVLTKKQHDRDVGGLTPDVIGLNVPDRYVFGCGMDYKNHCRQLDSIFAVKGL